MDFCGYNNKNNEKCIQEMHAEERVFIHLLYIEKLFHDMNCNT